MVDEPKEKGEVVVLEISECLQLQMNKNFPTIAIRGSRLEYLCDNLMNVSSAS